VSGFAIEPWKMEPLGYPEMSLINHLSKLRNAPEERIDQIEICKKKKIVYNLRFWD
jgi:hypothetical protein